MQVQRSVQRCSHRVMLVAVPSVIVSVHDQVSKCRKIAGNLSLTFRICLPPSEPGLPDTKMISMSGWSRLRLVNLVDTHARPWMVINEGQYYDM